MALRLFLLMVCGALIPAPIAMAQEKPAALPPKLGGEDHCSNPGVICDPPMLPVVKPKPNPLEPFLPSRPKLRRDSTKPPIPPHLKDFAGTTELSVCAESGGAVTGIAVKSSSGDERADKAAADWIAGQRFEPSHWFGIPLRKCHVTVLIEWRAP